MLNDLMQNSVFNWLFKEIMVPAIAFSLLYGTLKIIKHIFMRRSEINRILRSGIEDVDTMDGLEFERFFSDVLDLKGYRSINLLKGSDDKGVDVIASDNGVKIAFQCKRQAKNVGNRIVRDVHSGMIMHECQKAIIVTNAYFTANAIRDAESLGVELWDREELIEFLS